MTALTRRGFLKSVAVMGLAATIRLYVPEIRGVLAKAEAGEVHVIWMQGAQDTGCTISLLQGVSPDLVEAIQKFRLAVDFHPTIMVEAGEAALERLRGPVDVFILEGAIPTGDKKHCCTVGEIEGEPVPLEDWVRDLSGRAKHILAVGTCSSYGGIPAGSPNPTNCRGIRDVVRQEDREKVINIPGCPPHPDWMLSAIVAALEGWAIPLDEEGRPLAFFGHTIHDTCPRRGYYDEGLFKEEFGQGYLTDTCLLNLGCKGPITHADCSYRKWNSGLNMCTLSGAPCIACVEPEFPDPPTSPFYLAPPMPLKPPQPKPITLEDITKTAGISAAAGIAGYAIMRKMGKEKGEMPPEGE